jgi:NAD(P)-dependent dehydrogenase (short-subunit alcohol dehydrogenase family)
MGQVQDKVAYVTGGASGIGAACAATLAREGAKVVVTDIDDARGMALVESIGKAAVFFQYQDVTDETAWPGAIAAVEQRFGRLDIMVANAGIAVFGPALEMSLAEWRRQNAVNLDGVFLTVKYAVPAMRRAGGGRAEHAARSRGARAHRRAAGRAGGAAGDHQRRAVPRFRRVAAHDRGGAGDRRRHHGGLGSATELSAGRGNRGK